MDNTIRKLLIEQSDEKYQEFQSKLIPNLQISSFIGVRLPVLRKMAKDISKGDWQNFLEQAPEEYFDEVMLKGLVIGYIKMSIDEKLQWIEWFVPKISNWSIGDSFCSGLKISEKDRKKVWDFIMPYLNSTNEYDVRFGVVMLLNYFVEKEYIVMILRLFNSVKHDGYYVKMAVAWAVSVCCIHFPNKTIKFLGNNDLDDFTHNKAIQKMIESNRITEDTKNELRQLKRRSK
ncbi:DNA alkylation repair protein [Ureibacillus manganicus]|uniref:DNA alkylation repair protein n=1 Tax=Ureibacillus manganicus DSM 26584 TaxID=1384049 RepID=A0A0A3I0Y0_9BACL|nr:DNA alkylation repair protein [Ureibacillus manganicus]KGR78359.1 DNA alkylation repair protein [Ureibacillus manganicus DSM 26584]